MTEDERRAAPSMSQIALDLRAQGRTLLELETSVEKLSRRIEDVTVDQAVRAERDKHLNDRFDRIENSIKSVYGLGKWLLATMGTTLIAVLVNFVVGGGFAP